MSWNDIQSKTLGGLLNTYPSWKVWGPAFGILAEIDESLVIDAL